MSGEAKKKKNFVYTDIMAIGDWLIKVIMDECFASILWGTERYATLQKVFILLDFGYICLSH